GLALNQWRLMSVSASKYSPSRSRPLNGEYFDAETDIKRHWFKANPVVFHHGQDTSAKDEDYGEEELDDAPAIDGWWGTVWLNRSARYWAEVDKMLRAGKMFGSSGAISHFVRKDQKSGHIEVWPHAEQTLTPTPANPYARITAAKALAGFTSAGIALDDDLRRDLLTSGEPSGDLLGGGDVA